MNRSLAVSPCIACAAAFTGEDSGSSCLAQVAAARPYPSAPVLAKSE